MPGIHVNGTYLRLLAVAALLILVPLHAVADSDLNDADQKILDEIRDAQLHRPADFDEESRRIDNFFRRGDARIPAIQDPVDAIAISRELERSAVVDWCAHDLELWGQGPESQRRLNAAAAVLRPLAERAEQLAKKRPRAVSPKLADQITVENGRAAYFQALSLSSNVLDPTASKVIPLTAQAAVAHDVMEQMARYVSLHSNDFPARILLAKLVLLTDDTATAHAMFGRIVADLVQRDDDENILDEHEARFFVVQSAIVGGDVRLAAKEKSLYDAWATKVYPRKLKEAGQTQDQIDSDTPFERSFLMIQQYRIDVIAFQADGEQSSFDKSHACLDSLYKTFPKFQKDFDAHKQSPPPLPRGPDGKARFHLGPGFYPALTTTRPVKAS